MPIGTAGITAADTFAALAGFKAFASVLSNPTPNEQVNLKHGSNDMASD